MSALTDEQRASLRGLGQGEYLKACEAIASDLAAERDRARASAVALDAELLALKELAAEMCSAWNSGETSERTGAAHAALEQAVWGDRR